MADVVIIGDGPGGLSAALFLAKNDLVTVVFGKDETAMHWAQLHNYLGIPEMHGSAFQEIARKQAKDQGAELVSEKVGAVKQDEDGVFEVMAGDRTEVARYLILSEGKKAVLAQMLGLKADGGLEVDRNGRTAVDKVYAVGRMTRPGRSQAIISAGDGAAAAIDILARHRDKDDFKDWDSPPKED